MPARTLSLVIQLGVCLAAYQVTCWMVALLPRRSLIGWSVGLFGIGAIALGKPSRRVLLAQFLAPVLVLAGVSYADLYLAHHGVLSGLDQRPITRAITTLVALVVGALLQALRFLGEMRFPIWGDARVLATVQRSRALGGVVLFTARGRAYLRERFGATPREFLLSVR
jgi:hypothetical protein